VRPRRFCCRTNRRYVAEQGNRPISGS